MQNHNTNTSLSPIQHLALEELTKAFSLLNSLEQDNEIEEGELSWALGALGRAIRLKTHLSHDDFPTDSIKLINQSLELFNKHEEWQDEFLLENQFSDFLDSFEEILQEDEITQLEIMHYMIEFDRIVCALQVPIESFRVHSQATLERLVDSVSLFVDLYPESFNKVSEKANNFILCHGEQGLWGAIWRKITETPERAEAFAKLKQQDEELDLKQPLAAFDFSAYLDEEEEPSNINIAKIWKQVQDFFGISSEAEPVLLQFNSYLPAASANKDTDLVSDQRYKSLVVLSGKVFELNTQKELDLKDNKIECFMTISEKQVIKFNVGALIPTKNMRIKLGNRIITSDQDGLFITVALNLETEAAQKIQLLIDQYTVYETSLLEMIK